jgi:hypothetical protein
MTFAALLERAEETNTFDHRILQDAHGHMAAYYRWISRTTHEPIYSKNKQLYRNYLIDAWKTYVTYELQDLGKDLGFLESVVRACAYGNTKAGGEAEQKLKEILDNRYGLDCIEFGSGFVTHPVAFKIEE